MWKYYICSNSGSYSNNITVSSMLSIYYMPNIQLSGFTCLFSHLILINYNKDYEKMRQAIFESLTSRNGRLGLR